MFPIHAPYLQIAASGRAREVPEIESKNPRLFSERDQEEARAIVQILTKGLGRAAKAVLQPDPILLDGLLADHNCHTASLEVITALQKQREEAETLSTQIKSIPKQFSKMMPPTSLVNEALGAIQLSEKMRYLAYLAILKEGTVWVDNPDGTNTRKIDTTRLTNSPLVRPFMPQLIVKIRELMNQRSVGSICQLSGKPLVAKDGIGPLGEKFTYPCAYDVVDRVFRALAKQNVPFVFIERRRHQVDPIKPLLFVPDASASFLQVDPASLPETTPVVVVGVNFNQDVPKEVLEERLKKAGIFPFLLSSAATLPQFDDQTPTTANADLKNLPPHTQRIIASDRAIGRTMENDIGAVKHTHVDLLGHIFGGKK